MKQLATVQIRDYPQLQKQARGLGADAKKAAQRTIGDFRSRGPGWVSSAVTGVYNIKKKEVTAARAGTRAEGQLTVKGELENVVLVYEGSPLTPTHFGMKPTSRPQPTRDASGRVIKRARKYSVIAQIFRGQTVTLGSNVFLGRAGISSPIDIPFQREGGSRVPIRSVKTLSIPQMIQNPSVEVGITDNITDGLGKRLEHHIQQAQKRQS